jgi:hypothetical protein
MENFKGNENKGFLWAFFNEQNLFDGINIKFKDDIKSLFERTVEYVSRQNQLITLADKNKETIRIMVGKLNEYKQLSHSPNQTQNQNQHQNQNALRSKGIYSSSDIHDERQRKFDSELQRKKNEFDAISPKKPETIDFSDKNMDSPIGEENIDALIAKTIAMREQQLNQIMDFQEPSKAAEWIGTSINASTNSANSNNIVNLKIGKETPIPEKHIVTLDDSKSVNNISSNTKHVSFSNNDEIRTFTENSEESISNELSPFSQNNISNFFSKLKKNEQVQPIKESVAIANINKNDNTNIHEKLNILNEKLDKVLSQMEFIIRSLNLSTSDSK